MALPRKKTRDTLAGFIFTCGNCDKSHFQLSSEGVEHQEVMSITLEVHLLDWPHPQKGAPNVAGQ